MVVSSKAFIKYDSLIDMGTLTVQIESCWFFSMERYQKVFKSVND